MEYLVGFIFAAAIAGFADGLGFDRDRSFAPTVLIVIAFYYVLFAVQGGSSRALVTESVFAGGFVLLAVVGFRKNAWLAPAAIVGHGVFDFFHRSLIDDPGVPDWWPGFCGAIDVLLGACLVWLVIRRSRQGENPPRHASDARS